MGGRNRGSRGRGALAKRDLVGLPRKVREGREPTRTSCAACPVFGWREGVHHHVELLTSGRGILDGIGKVCVGRDRVVLARDVDIITVGRTVVSCLYTSVQPVDGTNEQQSVREERKEWLSISIYRHKNERIRLRFKGGANLLSSCARTTKTTISISVHSPRP